MSSFLPTILEGSSDIAASTFNPAAAAAATGGSSDTQWWLQKNVRPAAPESVASSTRAVATGVASSMVSEVGAVMDGSTTAVAGQGGEGAEQADPEAANGGPPLKQKRRPSQISRENKKKVGLVCLFAVLLVLVVIIVLVVIVHSLDRDDGQTVTTNATSLPTSDALGMNETGTSTAATLSPTVAESTFVTDLVETDDFIGGDTEEPGTDEIDALLVQLDAAVFSIYGKTLPHMSSELFSTEDSPRYQARMWILHTDTLLQPMILESTTATAELTAATTSTASTTSQTMEPLDRIAQRYVMLVFYFATAKDPQTPNSKFNVQPDTHECFWVKNACGQDDTSDGSTIAVNSNSNPSTDATGTTLNSEFIMYLNVSHADLQGTLPHELGYLSGLRELAVDGNQLTGTVPDLLLTQSQFLYVLDLSQNSFNGTIPSALWTLPTLRFVYLHGNQFTGSIPQTLTEAPSDNLEEIWLRGNQLTGSIPEWWTQLPNLDTLWVSNNTFSGQFPQEWSLASKLHFMDVSYNQITGTIPPSLLYGLPALQHLYLDYNKFFGTLPTTIPLDMTVSVSRSDLQLEAVWLQHNELTGTIPQGFGWQWNKLKTLELHGNSLTGEWECIAPGSDYSDVWPQLEELAVDCIPPEGDAKATEGVDISQCTACCKTCH